MRHSLFAVILICLGSAFALTACNPINAPGSPPNNITVTWTPSPTVTQTATGSPAVTISVTPTATNTGTPASGPQACAPTTIGVAAGIAVMNYGQTRGFVLRSQADWDTYRGVAGTTAPVNFANEMLFVVNWGTEYCAAGPGQAVQGRVVEKSITSTCASPSSVDVTVASGSSCTCGGSCVYLMGGNQVVAAVLPWSALSVNVTGVTDVVQNLP